jgi:hypothetical protein
MSLTVLQPRKLSLPMRWPHAGNDSSRPGLRARRPVRSLIRLKRLPRGLLYASNLASRLIPRPHPVGVTSTLKLGAAIKSP